MSDEQTTVIAMVALNAAEFPNMSDVLATLKERYPSGNVVHEEERDETAILTLDGNMTAVSLMPAPIPWPEIEGPCATAWWWPEAEERMKSHCAHAIVALLGDSGTPLERHISLTHLVSSLLACSDAAGVYWGNGTVVHAPDAFQDQAADISADAVAPQLWVDMRLEQNDDESFRYFTTGMTALGHPEVEIDRTTLSPREILNLCYEIVSYILTGGTPLKHGETIGRSAEERIAVTHEPSMFDREGNVIKLAIP